MPTDVWLRLVHRDASGGPLFEDVALLTLAPLLYLSNLAPAISVFVVYDWAQNHNFVYDVLEACNEAFIVGVTLPPDTSTHLTPNVTSTSRPPASAAVYLLDGQRAARHGRPDLWIQDQIEIGYVSDPRRMIHVITGMRRAQAGLTRFIHEQAATLGLGLVDLDPVAGDDDAGGNLEVSPPVPSATGVIAADAGGPRVPRHPAAPLGKLIVGDTHDRPLVAATREFLFAQGVQPVLPINVEWLWVGHADEVVSFVPRATASRGFATLMTSPHAMTVLLEAVQRLVPPTLRTNHHRGCFNDLLRSYDEVSLEQLLSGLRTTNESIQGNYVTPIRRRLINGLALDEREIIPLPIYYFEPGSPFRAVISTPSASYGTGSLSGTPRHLAFTVSLVNCQVVNRVVMVSKPFGLRVPPQLATAVLEATFHGLNLGVTPRFASAGGDWRWARPGLELDRFAMFFTEPGTPAGRAEIVNALRSGTAVSPALRAQVAARRDQIVAHPDNRSLPLSGNGASTTFAQWRRVWIPEPTVDVVEAYVTSVLDGLTVRFVDAWHYHVREGEVHCGSNVLRTPPAERWWDHFDPTVTTRYTV
jgi:hypothetical protein